MQRDALEARILHRRQQFAPRRFDFGQFRQSVEHTGNGPQRALAPRHMLPSRFQAHICRRLQMPSAARSARAPIVEVGLTAALVVNELPSTMNRFATSCARCHLSMTDRCGSVPIRAVPISARSS